MNAAKSFRATRGVCRVATLNPAAPNADQTTTAPAPWGFAFLPRRESTSRVRRQPQRAGPGCSPRLSRTGTSCTTAGLSRPFPRPRPQPYHRCTERVRSRHPAREGLISRCGIPYRNCITIGDSAPQQDGAGGGKESIQPGENRRHPSRSEGFLCGISGRKKHAERG